MSKLSIFDIVALAKAGYKAADIKELTELDVPDQKDDKSADDKKDDPDSQPPAENGQKDASNDKGGEPDKGNDVDYKSLYEAKCAELEAAQKTNVHQNQPTPDKSNQDRLNDIVRSFM